MLPIFNTYLFDSFFLSTPSLYSCVKRPCPMATFRQFSTAAATTAPRSPPSNCSSLVILQICARLCATFATDSLQEDCMQWARAPGRAFSCLTWGSVDHPAMWRRPFACHPCSAVRAGLRTGYAGPCSGHWCSTRRHVSAGMEGGRRTAGGGDMLA